MLFVLTFLYVYMSLNKRRKRRNSMLSQSEFSQFTQLNISINNILVFAAVMNTGGIVPASYCMNCSPSAISLSLKKFCTNFPGKLFNREGRRLIPTEEAHLLYANITPAVKNLLHAMNCSINSSSEIAAQV